MLDKDFYKRDTEVVAKELLGNTLAHETGDQKVSGRIVEVEAYYGDQKVKDPASHAANGKTERNKVMYDTYGCAYVYLCYGIHELFNITTNSVGEPGAVLIRALEPQDGIEIMKNRRNTQNVEKLTSGPGKLTRALNITKDYNGLDLTKGDLYVERYKGDKNFNIERTERIGVSEGKDLKLRFLIKGNKFVSK